MGKTILILLILASCTAPAVQVGKLAASHPDLIIAKANELAPCVHGGTITVNTFDSSGWIDALHKRQDQNVRLGRLVDSLLAIHRPTIITVADSACYDLVDVLDGTIKDLRDENDALRSLPPVIHIVSTHDTIIDGRQIKILADQNAKLIDQFGPLTDELDSWKGKARNRFWIIFGLGALLGVSLYSNIAGIFKPKVTV